MTNVECRGYRDHVTGAPHTRDMFERANFHLVQLSNTLLRPPIMSTFLELYEPLDIIGNGSFGIIRKVRRKSDGLVSTLLPPVFHFASSGLYCRYLHEKNSTLSA